MEKPSEKAVSDFEGSATYSYSSYSSGSWNVYLSWYYDSADPGEYLIVCKREGSSEVEEVTSGDLKSFKKMTYTDYQSFYGKYTYTIYTLGNGFSTSASKSVTVNCEYPTYIYPDNNSSSGSGSLSSLSGTSWSNSNSSISFASSSSAYFNGTDVAYTYSSGSGRLSLMQTGTEIATFKVSGDTLTLYLSGMSTGVTLYKD
ncbi:MAG: hypothetical protein NC041_03865 [Bacteroides sp.]|nr:hypothetical protein [Prevotella sp.]MCM1407843.1 hypothetical protein [Treponema brennaborense]MCM1469585.1 hypothetical protein [Bacteroides sp.]